MHFLGHSTVLIELGGQRILTDPVLLPQVSMLLRRVGPACDPALFADIDIVVISHLHYDHLHLPSLRLLGRDTRIVVPAGAGQFLRVRGFTQVVELAPGADIEIDGVCVTATPAVHDGFRPPFGPRADAVGYLLEADGLRVYFAGDTDLFDSMAGFGAVDAALIPVWGWGPNLGPGHLDPTGAAEAVRRMRPRLAMPIHWGTLRPYGAGRWMRHHLVGPPRAFADAVADLRLPTQVVVTEPGSRVQP